MFYLSHRGSALILRASDFDVYAHSANGEPPLHLNDMSVRRPSEQATVCDIHRVIQGQVQVPPRRCRSHPMSGHVFYQLLKLTSFLEIIRIGIASICKLVTCEKSDV